MTHLTPLESTEFPQKKKSTLPYKEWVQRSFLSTILNPQTFTQQLQQFVTNFSCETWTNYTLMKDERWLPSFRLCHHFSGHIEELGKIICFMLNPRLDHHTLLEYARILFLGLPLNLIITKTAEDYTKRYEVVKNNSQEQNKVAEYFWLDEGNRFIHVYDLIQALRNPVSKKEIIQHYGVKRLNIPQWRYFKKILRIGLGIQEKYHNINYQNDQIWQAANDHLVTIDLIPYFSVNWEFKPSKNMVPYLLQALQAIKIVKTNKPILLIGTAYRDLLKLLINFPTPGLKVKLIPKTLNYQQKGVTKSFAYHEVLLHDSAFLSSHKYLCLPIDQVASPELISELVSTILTKFC